ncbi:MAG: hypothetical protein KF855_03365 [Acidobacteria bacterium]|nr:hypothetical protein [Acidobacteriota bacterium]
MFNKALIKAQQKEIARLRRDLVNANRRVDEVLDKFLFNRTPERLVSNNEVQVMESLDPFTRAERDAIERAEQSVKAQSNSTL